MCLGRPSLWQGAVVEIRTARHDDWSQIWPFFRDIVADGET